MIILEYILEHTIGSNTFYLCNGDKDMYIIRAASYILFKIDFDFELWPNLILYDERDDEEREFKNGYIEAQKHFLKIMPLL